MRGLLIVGLILTAFCSWANAPKSTGTTKEGPPKIVESSDKAQGSRYPTKDAPLPITVLQSPEDAAHTAAREQKADADEHDYLITQKQLASVAKPTVVIAAIGATISIFALIFLWRTFRETKRTADAAKNSADAATRAAVAAEQNVAVMKETAKHQLRAYVFIKGINGIPHTTIEGAVKGYIIFADFENIGSTPANDVGIWVKFRFCPVNGPIPPFEPQPNDLRAIVGPHVSAKSGYMEIPVADLSQVWRNEVEIYAWVRIEYRDIFDVGFLHHHEMCVQVVLIHNPVDVPPQGHAPYIQFISKGPQNTAS